MLAGQRGKLNRYNIKQAKEYAMKLNFKTLAALACTALCTLPLTACNKDTGKSSLLGAPAEVKFLDYSERQGEEFVEFKKGVESFASSFAEYAFADYEKQNNFAVSPISVYMALSLAAECANGETRNEILNALGTTYGQLTANFSLLYRSLAFKNTQGKKITGMLNPTNSIWVNEGTQVNQSCINALSDYYYCHSYSADFARDNEGANKAVRNFIKEQTNGLIDRNFDLKPDTVFTLINTLYLKSRWNLFGDELPFTADKYDFKNADGSTTSKKLLRGYYRAGRVYAGETYSTFYTSTYDGIRIKFILPNEGYTVGDVFTAENIAAMNSIEDYNADDHENKIHYYTRCLFPEYKCSYDGYVTKILQQKFGVNSLFDSKRCDLSSLLNGEAYCDNVRHVTELKVDKTGVEGAAVTIITGAGAAGPDGYEEVYEDFVLNKGFGFIITDYDNTTLFSGVVNAI